LRKIRRLTPNFSNRSSIFGRRGHFFAVLAIFFLTASPALRAQVLNLQAGASISNLHSSIGGMNYTFLGHTRDDLSAFIGMEYLERKYWSISSNVGFVRKGGRESWWDSTGGPVPQVTETFDYVSFNTLFNLKYPIGKWIPYVSVGPRVDFMVSHTHFFPYFDYPGFLQNKSYGLVAAIGLRYAFSSFLVGIRAEHLYNFNHLVSQNDEINSTHTGIVSVTAGYRFRSRRAPHH
jgi:hypothetical protein